MTETRGKGTQRRSGAAPSRAGPGGEDRLVAWLAAHPETKGLIGNDAALLPAGGPWAVTVDSQRAGVHHPHDLAPARAAERLLAVNLSDLAAVGARPRYAFLALGLPPLVEPRPYLTALLRACRRYDLTLAGGDVSLAPVAEATLTLLGERPPHGRFLTRTAAHPGDTVWLGGTVGESAAGRHLLARGARFEGRSVTLPKGLPPRLASAARRAVRRHLAPTPQLELGYWLGRRRAPVAAIDLSDGLARDLTRLAKASGVGVRLDSQAIATPPGFPELADWLGLDPLELALGGGEDYVLLFTLPRRSAAPEGCRRIAELTSQRAALILDGPGGETPLPELGWDHLADVT